MERLRDRVAYVTGAASGIGRASALRLAEEGASLLLSDVAEEGLAETAGLAAERGAKVETRRCDVSDEAQAGEAVAACVGRFGRLDVVCNVAGILAFEHTHEVAFDAWRRIMAVNLDGTFLTCRAAIPHLLETRGAIVNMGSTAGLMGLPYGAAYGASKGAVHALTRAIAVEYAKRGLRCNAICPASIETRMAKPRFPEGVEMKLLLRPASLSGARGPEDVANLVAFLASDEARHINGETIRIDGAALA